IEEDRRLPERIRVRPPHEAVADEADVETLLHRSVPTMRVANRAHGSEDVIPRLLLGHDRVWKHAAVPADVIELALHAAVVVAQPEPRVPHDVEPAVRIMRKAVPPGLVVRTGSLHRP